MTEPTDELPAFSRGPTSDILGLLDDKIALRINADAKLDSMNIARRAGFRDHSEWVRMLIHRETYGIKHLENLALQRLRGKSQNDARMSDIPGGAVHG